MGFSIYPAATNRVKEFTSSGTWTCPSGVYSAEFLVVGAGGAGGGVGASSITRVASAGGGGGGAVKKVNLITTPGTSYTITIGAKGTGTAATGGGNGGYTEVLNGATTLIRSYGGRGGVGMDASDNDANPALTNNVAGGGGYASGTTTTNCGGGGGGASSGVGIGSTGTSLYSTTFTSNYLMGLEGAVGKIGSNTAIQPTSTMGGAGIDGYGAGGGAGAVHLTTASQVQNPVSSAPYGAGAGAALSATGSAVGSPALANTGSGGGGAATHTNTTSRAGGNGADGLVRIVYFA